MTSLKWRKNNPIKYAYQTLKDNAKRRGKEFDLTLEYFTEFCYKYQYIQNKGITKNSYTIDRISEEKGYVKNNIQIKTNSNNIKKYLEWKYRDTNNKNVFKTETIDLNNLETIDDIPF